MNVLLLLLLLAYAYASDPLLASSDRTLRTTSSVDLQVCAPGILSDDRVLFEAAAHTQLRTVLDDSTAIYLTRAYTTADAGAYCMLYVYQTPSPADAALVESQLADAMQASDVLIVLFQGAQVRCALAVVPWSGEDPPLPIWNMPASTMVMWTSVVGGALGVCLFAACVFVAIANMQDTRHTRALMASDRSAVHQLLLADMKRHSSSSAPAMAPAAKKSPV
jgi:hypothetical protein